MPSNLVVEVCKIEDIQEHNNADKLEICIIKGWQVIVRKNEFEKGTKVVYFPPDTLLPKEWTDKFGVTKYCHEKNNMMRIHRTRFRGEPSFGLVVSIAYPDWQEGREVAGYYGAKKYEPPVLCKHVNAAPEDPMVPKYTDIENMRNYPRIFENGEEIILTEKIHGCVHKDTLVMLANGEEVSVNEIKPGTMVLSFDEWENEAVPAKVKGVLTQPIIDGLDWFELEFDNGRILRCTEDHPILTHNRKWVIAKDLTEEDEIVEFS